MLDDHSQAITRKSRYLAHCPVKNSSDIGIGLGSDLDSVTVQHDTFEGWVRIGAVSCGNKSSLNRPWESSFVASKSCNLSIYSFFLMEKRGEKY